MTQLIDLIEDIKIFRKTEDHKDYYSSARSFRQIDESTIEAIYHINYYMGEFMIRSNLRYITFEDVSVSYDRIYEIVFNNLSNVDEDDRIVESVESYTCYLHEMIGEIKAICKEYNR